MNIEQAHLFFDVPKGKNRYLSIRMGLITFFSRVFFLHPESAERQDAINNQWEMR